MSQYLTEGVLRDHLGRLGVCVELSTEPISLEQNEGGVTVIVKKVFSDNTEKLETVQTPYVIGADGARGDFTEGSSIQLKQLNGF